MQLCRDAAAVFLNFLYGTAVFFAKSLQIVEAFLDLVQNFGRILDAHIAFVTDGFRNILHAVTEVRKCFRKGCGFV